MVEKITHELARRTHFTKLHSISPYLFTVCDYESSLLTTFNTPWGQYCFIHLSWGLACVQDIVQCIIDHICDCCDGVIGIADDFIVHGKDDEEHDRCLLKLMEVAHEHWLVFNGGKCAVIQWSVTYFGCVYHKVRTDPDSVKVSAIHSMPCQRHQHSSRSSSARSHTYHHSCLHFHPSLYLSMKNEVDASQKGIGVTLLQDGHPVTYASKVLTPIQQCYVNIEYEMLA